MKIIYFGSFDRHYDTEVYIANTLESLGCNVKRVKTTSCNLENIKELLKVKYDFILFSKGWFIGDQDKIKSYFKNINIPKVSWFFDLVFGTNRQRLLYEHQVFYSDIVFTTDRGHQKDFERLGLKHYCIRQGIYEPEAVLGKVRKKYKRDIVFVGGNAHGVAFRWLNRSELLQFLTKGYKDRFTWYGQESDREIRNLELNDLYASAKIVVGDSVYSPGYWSNRIYETLGRGGFLLFPVQDNFDFIAGKHFVSYNYGDYKGLKKKIDYYLIHEKERDEIRISGFKYCKAHYTYRHRCQEFLKIINNYNKKYAKRNL